MGRLIMCTDFTLKENDHDCKTLLKKELPDAEVSYSVEYGDKASRYRGNAELAKELEKLKE